MTSVRFILLAIWVAAIAAWGISSLQPLIVAGRGYFVRIQGGNIYCNSDYLADVPFEINWPRAEMSHRFEWPYLSAGVQVLPLWLIVLATFPLWLSLRRRTRTQHRQPIHGACESCGYDLTGNRSGRCPECGEQSGPSKTTPHAPA
ncbi:MAG: hypothetical protein H6818_13450 [Phycisphaerales bacterium]|nr:hypothetical protein [Phycisphaerales bacterium]MCB9862191.1 hypothetical protein [Phycisphaerales bacterium]